MGRKYVRVTLTFDLETRPSEAQICSAVPKIFDSQTKKKQKSHRQRQNRALSSSLCAVKTLSVSNMLQPQIVRTDKFSAVIQIQLPGSQVSECYREV